LVVELFDLLYELTLSPGSVCAREQRVSAAIEALVDEARAALRAGPAIGKDETYLWIFLTDPRIPVTNTLCERLLRYAVIRQAQLRLPVGGRHARILFFSASLHFQPGNVFSYLTEAVDAQFRGQASPSICRSPPSADVGK